MSVSGSKTTTAFPIFDPNVHLSPQDMYTTIEEAGCTLRDVSHYFAMPMTELTGYVSGKEPIRLCIAMLMAYYLGTPIATLLDDASGTAIAEQLGEWRREMLAWPVALTVVTPGRWGHFLATIDASVAQVQYVAPELMKRVNRQALDAFFDVTGGTLAFGATPAARAKRLAEVTIRLQNTSDIPLNVMFGRYVARGVNSMGYTQLRPTVVLAVLPESDDGRDFTVDRRDEPFKISGPEREGDVETMEMLLHWEGKKRLMLW